MGEKDRGRMTNLVHVPPAGELRLEGDAGKVGLRGSVGFAVGDVDSELRRLGAVGLPESGGGELGEQEAHEG